MLSQYQIDSLVVRYFDECKNGLVDKQPSRLNRGEGVLANYYLLKVDIARSTVILRRSSPSVYLQVAHTFLSVIDAITQNFDADSDQVEYAGDSVLAYFPDRVDTAKNVLSCAAACRSAALKINEIIPDLNSGMLITRIVLHYGPLVVSVIGPHGSPRKTVIGIPLHEIAHREKKINPGMGHATREYAKRLPREIRGRYLRGLVANIGAEILYPGQGISGYSINWGLLGRDLGLNLMGRPHQSGFL